VVNHNVSFIDAPYMPVTYGSSFSTVYAVSPVKTHVCAHYRPKIGKTAISKKFEGSHSVEYQSGEHYRRKFLWWQVFIQHRNVVSHI
jgi:hypothetical protein